MTTPWSALRTRGVLGINERNIRFTLGENPRRLYPLVDNKLKTKELCERAGIPSVPVLGKAGLHGDVGQLVETLRVSKQYPDTTPHGSKVFHDAVEEPVYRCTSTTLPSEVNVHGGSRHPVGEGFCASQVL